MSHFTGSRTFTMSTKLDKDSDQIDTVVTVVLDGVDDETILSGYFRNLRVDIAAGWRKDGHIPSTAIIHAREQRTSTKVLSKAQVKHSGVRMLSQAEIQEMLAARIALDEAAKSAE